MHEPNAGSQKSTVPVVTLPPLETAAVNVTAVPVVTEEFDSVSVVVVALAARRISTAISAESASSGTTSAFLLQPRRPTRQINSRAWI